MVTQSSWIVDEFTEAVAIDEGLQVECDSVDEGCCVGGDACRDR